MNEHRMAVQFANSSPMLEPSCDFVVADNHEDLSYRRCETERLTSNRELHFARIFHLLGCLKDFEAHDAAVAAETPGFARATKCAPETASYEHGAVPVQRSALAGQPYY